MNAPLVQVRVVYALPDDQVEVTLALACGSTLVDAIRQSGLMDRFGLDLATLRCGIFGHLEKEPAVRELKSGDRVEIYRPLLIDPKQARLARAERARAARQSRKT